MSSMSHQKASESQQQIEMPSTMQQAPEADMGNLAAVDEAGIESQGQSPKDRLDELLADPESDPFDVATAYAEMQDVHKILRMTNSEQDLQKATAGDPVAWQMIEGSYQTALANRQEFVAQMVAADGNLQAGIAATIEAALANHDEGIKEHATINFNQGKLKRTQAQLEHPRKAERRVDIGNELERVFGVPNVEITVANSDAMGFYSNLELGDVYSNQTVSGTARFDVRVGDRLGVQVDEHVQAEAAEAVVRQLPMMDDLVGLPTFEQ